MIITWPKVSLATSIPLNKFIPKVKIRFLNITIIVGPQCISPKEMRSSPIRISINYTSNDLIVSRIKSGKSTKNVITPNEHSHSKYPRPMSRVTPTYRNKNPKTTFLKKTMSNTTLRKSKRPSIMIDIPTKVAMFCRLSIIPNLKKIQVLISRPKAPKKLLKSRTSKTLR